MMYVSKCLLVCLFVHGLFVICNCNEPHCSKFHYEEALLEKMIRLEIKFEQMAKGYEDMSNLITTDRKKLHEDKERMKDKLEKSLQDSRAELDTLKNNIEMSRELIEKESQDMKASVEAISLDIEAKIARLSGDVNQHLNETIAKLSDATLTADVLFEVKDPLQTSLSSDKVVKYKTVVNNRGDDYKIDEGVFIAPMDGAYYFTAQFCVSGNYFYPSFVIDGVEKKRMAIGSSTTTCNNFDLLTTLKAGSRLSMVTQTSTSSTFYSDTYRQNMFTGIILRR